MKSSPIKTNLKENSFKVLEAFLWKKYKIEKKFKIKNITSNSGSSCLNTRRQCCADSTMQMTSRPLASRRANRGSLAIPGSWKISGSHFWCKHCECWLRSFAYRI